jgi:hypothetical protein
MDEKGASEAADGNKSDEEWFPPRGKEIVLCRAEVRYLVSISPRATQFGRYQVGRYADNGAASPATSSRLLKLPTSVTPPARYQNRDTKTTFGEYEVDALHSYRNGVLSQTRCPMYSNTIKQPGCRAPCMDGGEARPPHHHQPPNCLEAHTPRSNRLESGPVFSVAVRKPTSPTLYHVNPHRLHSPSGNPRFNPETAFTSTRSPAKPRPRAQTSRIRHRGGDTTGASEMKLASF